MTSICPHCRSSGEASPVDASNGQCPACGAFIVLEPLGFEPGEARVFGEGAGDDGLELDDGTTACPIVFGPYRVLGLIGKGGMGVVYRARHSQTLEEVAVKTVRVRKRGMLHRIRREILALARIEHPGLVRIIETGQAEGLPWYAMELLRGESLHDRLRKARRGLGIDVGPSQRESSGWDTRADFILALDPDQDDPRLGPLADGPTATVGHEALLPASQFETLQNLTPLEPESLTTAEVAGPPGETPTVIVQPPTAVDRADEQPTLIASEGDPATVILEGECREFLILMARLCGTLAYLHGEGIVHRDLKPQNVIIRPDGTPVLLDFGLASYFGACGRESLDVGGKIEGTPEYMSPEQIRGEDLDARTDLYAIGCILYEGVTGRVPFRAGSASATLRAQVKQPPISPRVHKSDIPEPLNDLILQLLTKRAGDRPGYARDIIVALERLGCIAPGWATDRPSRDYLYRPGFVGRSSSLAMMEKHVRRSLARPGHCIFLKGQSGVGKTRFIMELARRFEQRGLTVVTGECVPIGVGGSEDADLAVRATPLHPFRSFLQMIADCCLERGCDEVSRLLGPGGGVLAECEPSLASLPGLAVDEGPADEGESEGALQSRLIEALGETLQAFARTSPLVLFLDDLEWADAPTLHFLALFHVGVWDSPNVAIVAAFRTEGEEAAIRGYRPVFQDATFVEVGPLEEASLGEIVRDMLGSNDVDDRFVEHLARRSGGNPFFVAEYLRAAVAEGLLRRDESGCWRPAAHEDDLDPVALDAAIPLPESLHDLVVRRLSTLPDDSREVLEVAAIYGREVDADFLDFLEPLGESRTIAAVASLFVAQVLEAGRDDCIRFSHDKLREIAYEQIPPPRRRALHRSVALAMEARYDSEEDRARHSSTLAHHWYRAIGDRQADPEAVERAIEYLGLSIRLAVHSGLPGEAVEYGRAAARLLGVELPEDPRAIADALAIERTLILDAFGDRKLGDLRDLPLSTDPETNRTIDLLLSIQPPAYLSNQLGLFALLASKSLAMTLSGGLGPKAPTVLAMFALVERILLDHARTARDYAALAVELDRRGGGEQASQVLFLKGWFVDHWVSPIRDILPDLEVGGRQGLEGGEVLYGSYNHAAYVALLAASGEPLERVIEQAEARIPLIGHRVTIARFHCVLERQLARALAGLTEAPTSLTDEWFDESRDLSFICQTTNANQVGFYHVARLRLHYYRGEYREALQAAERALAVAEAFARQPAEVDLIFFRALALLAMAAKEIEPKRTEHLLAAREHLSVLTRWREDCETNFGHKVLLVGAELARVEGEVDEARRLYHEAIRSAEVCGFTHHAALARHLAARHLARLGEDAGTMLQAAIESYRSWGAEALADRLDAHC